MTSIIKMKGEVPAFNGPRRFSWPLAVLLSIVALIGPVSAQRAAVIALEKRGTEFAERLAAGLSNKIRVLDLDLSWAAYASAPPSTPFNLTVEEAKRIGTVIGCDAFVLVRSAIQRRSAFGRAEYYEAYAAVYVVSSRTGRLIWWHLTSHEAPQSAAAGKLLDGALDGLADRIAEHILIALEREVRQRAPGPIEELPDEGSPLVKDLRPPVPYNRIKPGYTSMAALYEVSATIEAMVDLDAEGAVKCIDFVRWAGFGLEESVEKAIRDMNWRPAERKGKPLAMRFLLRYNFKKLDKDPPDP